MRGKQTQESFCNYNSFTFVKPTVVPRLLGALEMLSYRINTVKTAWYASIACLQVVLPTPPLL